MTIEIEPTHRIPKIDTLIPKVAAPVRLQDIVRRKQTRILVKGLRDANYGSVSLTLPAGRKRIAKDL